jgi:hypothetical protein
MVEQQVRNQSVEPQRRIALISVPWEDVSDPGTYVEVCSGEPVPFVPHPQEGLNAGGPPINRKESTGVSRLVDKRN